MISPVWQGDYEITQAWGCTDVQVEPYWPTCLPFRRFHCGIDIGMNSGTPLYAARAGVVAVVGYGELGIRVGSQTDYYIHIDRAVVNFGAVAQGQLIAYSGAKVPAGGSLTGPHLHFEVQKGALNAPGTSLDPMPILSPTAGADTGGDDMFTDDDRKQLQGIFGSIGDGKGRQIMPQLAGVFDSVGNGAGATLFGLLNEIKGQLAALPAAGGLSAAQEAKISDIQTTVNRIENALKGA